MRRLCADIEGIGLLGPGLDTWASSAPLLGDPAGYSPRPTVLPVPEGLPPAERRRVGRVVKLALGVGLQATTAAHADPTSLPSVFSSSGGDGHNCHEICNTLALDDPQISPTRFHNSVHNAAAGYWSIATGAKTSSNALCAFDASFSAGMLEAFTQVLMDDTSVLLVAYDAQYPPPLHSKRPIPDAFGVAFVLSPAGTRAPVARVQISVGDLPVDTMTDARLESLRSSIPAGRSLPLLRLLALGQTGTVALEYLDGRSLVAEIVSCS